MAVQYCKTDGLFHEPAHLVVDGATVSYGEKTALRDVTFCVSVGTRVAVIGPNGAGKSTLFKALVGLIPLREGSILIHGLPPGHHLDCVAYVPQREEVEWSFPVTVAEVVMMGRYGRLGWLKRPGKQDRAAVAGCLEKLNIADLADRPIGSLSGGQQQRVFLARALVQEPHIVLMDEPFTGVDISTQETTLALFEQLRQQQVTVLVSTHDLNLAATRFDEVLLLNRRLVAAGPPAETLTSQVLTEAFGGQVLFLNGAVVVDKAAHKPEQYEG
ncbi:MAG: metal ABC transporter ATP-binding protein [Syntrophobacteraceae bacterium]